MRLSGANIAGLTSPLQHAEMKSILAGAWPPLKPLPVFKYETADYRATIDFDKKRGEWVCRKTSLPSNKVQELRGGLKEITMALPHGEVEIFAEDSEQQEQELVKDRNRRLQAIREWKERYESGALYFELRNYLSESQQIEIDDSLRLSLTARQLQFNPKNVAYVFDVLSTAGGRFATLIEFAKRKNVKQGTEPQAQGETAVHEAERAMDQNKQSPETGSREFESVLDDRIVRDQEATARCTGAHELPDVSIKDVLPEQEQTSLAERTAPHIASQQFEMETSEIVDTDSPSLVEDSYHEGHHPPAFADFAAQAQTDEPSAECIEGSPSRVPALEISVVQVAAFALLFSCAMIAFTIGLTMGRGPLASRLWEAPRSILGMDAKPPAMTDPADKSISQISTPAVTRANESGNTSTLGKATPSERKSEENTRGSEDFAKARSTDADSSESTASANREVSLEPSGAMEPGSPASRRLTPTISAALDLQKSSTAGARGAPATPIPFDSSFRTEPAKRGISLSILVTRPGPGSQPLRVSFPEKAIAATSSLAMSSQLSVLVSAEPGLGLAHKSARLEAGNLVSFVWPRYPRPRGRHGLAETIRVRATIGELGQVRDVKFLSGSSSLLLATKAAIRQWRYSPTLLDKRLVQAQQDVTIEFRPPQYPSRVSRPPKHIEQQQTKNQTPSL